jgi:hypothetical protein
VANPFEICLALGNEAIDKGVKVMEHCQVKIQGHGVLWGEENY